MPSPKTWDLLGAIETCLQAITIAGGYYTDAGSFVTREPHQIPEDQGAVIAVALDALKRADDPAVRTIGRKVDVLVFAKVSTALNDAQQRLHELIDDIERAMDRRDAFPERTHFPTFVEATVIPPADGVKWIGAQVRYSATVIRR